MTEPATPSTASAVPPQSDRSAPQAPAPDIAKESPAPAAGQAPVADAAMEASAAPAGQAAKAAPERHPFGFVSLVLLLNYLLCLLMLGTPLWLYRGACFVSAFFLSLFMDAGSGRASRFTQKHVRNQSMAVFIFLSATVLYVAGGFVWLVQSAGFKPLVHAFLDFSLASRPQDFMNAAMSFAGFRQVLELVPLYVLLAVAWPLARILRGLAGLAAGLPPVSLFSVKGVLLSLAAMAGTALLYSGVCRQALALAKP